MLKGEDVLGLGIDWSEEFHLVALGTREEGLTEVAPVDHTPKAVEALVASAALEPDPAEVRVVIECRHGMLVARLVDEGCVVVPVNPREMPSPQPRATSSETRSSAGPSAASTRSG